MKAQSSQPYMPLFKTIADVESHVEISFNDRPLSVPSGRPLAAALLAAGVVYFRTTPVSGASRAPFCMMGACFECLVEIDGVPSRQSCMVPVRAGMQVRSQEGARDLPPELTTVINSSENGYVR